MSETLTNSQQQSLLAMMQQCLREVQELRKAIETERLDQTPLYSIKQVCTLVGISRYALYKLWRDKRLHIPEPCLKNGVRPYYSKADIYSIKEALKD